MYNPTCRLVQNVVDPKSVRALIEQNSLNTSYIRPRLSSSAAASLRSSVFLLTKT